MNLTERYIKPAGLIVMSIAVLIGAQWFQVTDPGSLANISSKVLDPIQDVHAHTDMPGSLPHNIPDFTREPGKSVIVSANNGNWSSSSTWVGGVIPTSNHIVEIDSTHTVTITDQSAAAHTVAVFGKLAFSTSSNTTLKVSNLMVLEIGTLQVGTASQPIASNVKAEIIIADKALNTSFDPEQYGNSVLGFGKIYLHGAAKNPTYVKLGVEPKAGHTSLTFAESVSGWRVGDLLRLPNSNQLNKNRGRGFEEFTITSISSDAKTVGLSSAVAYEHPGAREGDGVTMTNIGGRTLMPYVMNTTRNVVIRSENPSGNRGHMLVTHRADLDMRYTEIKDMGRTKLGALNSTKFNIDGTVSAIGTNQIGRYTLHLHHLYGPANSSNTGYQYELVGNSIHDGQKWGLAIHGTHYGLVQNNVMYDFLGAGLFTEDGSESFNVIERNFISNMSGLEGNEMKSGQAADPFWFHSPTNYIRDNVAANGINGYAMFMQDLDESYNSYSKVPKFRGADTTNPDQYTLVAMRKMPILEFARNESYSQVEAGVNLWSLGEANMADVPRSIFKDTYIWHNEYDGFFAYFAHNMTADGLYVRGDIRQVVGTSALKYVMNRGEGFTNVRAGYQTRLVNVDIQGMEKGINVPRETSNFRDGYGPFVVENAYLRNHRNVVINTTTDPGDYSDRQVYFSNVRHASMANLRSVDSKYYEYALSHGAPETPRKGEFYVLNHNAVSGVNFQMYWPGQNTTPIAGVTAPCGSSRTFILGIVCTITSKTVPVFTTGGTVPPPPPNPLPPPPPPAGSPVPIINSFISDPTQIVKGGQAQISWSTTNATSVSITNIGLVTASGSRIVTPTASTSYILTATNSGGSVTSSVNVSVTVAEATVTFTASPEQINAGQSATLTWSTTNASNVSISGIGDVSNSGSKTVTPSVSTDYSLTATNSAGVATIKSVSVEVIPAAPTPVPPPVPLPTPVPPPVTPTNQLPQGSFDEINTAGVVRGWSFDPDSSSATNSIHVYVDSPAGAGKTPYVTINTSLLRSDVNSSKGIAGTHGFEYTIPAALKNNVTHTVYLYAIDINDANKSTLLAGSPKSFKLSTIDTPPPPPSSGGGGGGSTRPTPPPSVKPTPTPVPSAGRHTRGTLVNHNGTIYFLGADLRYPFPSAAVFLSWGSRFEDVVPANSGDVAMPIGPVVEYKTSPGVTRHPRATLVNHNGTIYFLGADVRYPFPSAAVFLSWGSRFQDVVPANSGDIAMPVGPLVQRKK